MSSQTLWGYGEVSQNIETKLYAGPLRIPAENFQPRIRRETYGKDTVNSRYIESWNAQVPRQQPQFIHIEGPGMQVITFKKVGNDLSNANVFDSYAAPSINTTAGGKSGSYSANVYTDQSVPIQMKTTYEDMQPVPTRIDKRDFRQSKPYDSSGPNLSLNPFFDRYDPTRDPRNMIREVNSVVYELKTADRGLQESARVRERSFANRYIPEGETPTKLTQSYELMRPKIDNPEIVYRDQKNTLWKYGASL
jgi:hypothetical protein